MTNVREVRKSVDSRAEQCGRKGAVSLMAVSKTHPYSAIMDCYEEGQRLFGENRVQEVCEKFPPVSQRPEGMKLCLIGHLQRNKVKKILPLVDRIDSVDSTALMDELEKELAKTDRCIEILFEVNSSHEEQKSGFADEKALFEAADHLALCPHLILKGLMTVGPLGFDEEKNRAAFRYAKALFDRLSQRFDLTVLSMGMSADYLQAIEEGSTEVRIGTAIFGQRTYDAT